MLSLAIAAATVFIELTAEPAAVPCAREHALQAQAAIAVDQVARVEQQQSPITAALPDGAFRYSMSRAANGIAAELEAYQIARIAAMPDVKRLIPMSPLNLGL